MLRAILVMLPQEWLVVTSCVSWAWRRLSADVICTSPAPFPMCVFGYAERRKQLLWLIAWGEGTCSVAVWLTERMGVEWTACMTETAALNGRHDLVAAMLAASRRNARPPPVNERCVVAALIGCGLHIVRAMHALGAPLTKRVMRAAVALGRERDIRWLVRKNCPCGTTAVAMAIAAGGHRLLPVLAQPMNVVQDAEDMAQCKNKSIVRNAARLEYGRRALALDVFETVDDGSLRFRYTYKSTMFRHCDLHSNSLLFNRSYIIPDACDLWRSTDCYPVWRDFLAFAPEPKPDPSRAIVRHERVEHRAARRTRRQRSKINTRVQSRHMGRTRRW
jgi:hypothetical protein